MTEEKKLVRKRAGEFFAEIEYIRGIFEDNCNLPGPIASTINQYYMSSEGLMACWGDISDKILHFKSMLPVKIRFQEMPQSAQECQALLNEFQSLMNDRIKEDQVTLMVYHFYALALKYYPTLTAGGGITDSSIATIGNSIIIFGAILALAHFAITTRGEQASNTKLLSDLLNDIASFRELLKEREKKSENISTNSDDPQDTCAKLF
ncbi:MAG TPA: hypothetical protein VHE99_10900 [Gammaproteobacteria bacterium]|nr:hypothetical protein [Gammaproteobacteria bacterium]